METFGHRVRTARVRLGWSQERLANEIGVKQPSIADIEKKASGGSKFSLSIALKTGVRPEWLETGDGPMLLADAANPASNRRTQARVNDGAHQMQTKVAPGTVGNSDGPLRVLGMAEGGPDGWALWNGDTIEWIPRPANLAGVPDAYAVYVTGESMVPRYQHGELAHIHPKKPITPGCFVLVQRKPKVEGDPPLAVIKRLVRRSGARVVLEQYNPPKTFEIKVDDVVSMHRVVGSGEA